MSDYSPYTTAASTRPKRYWHQKHGCDVPTAEEVPGGSYMMHILEAVMAAARRIPKPDVTCYLVSREIWDKLLTKIPLEVADHKAQAMGTWPGLMTLQGIPIFVYHSDKERLTLRFQLIQAGHIVGEVEHGPVL